jgi:hypothetical protein
MEMLGVLSRESRELNQAAHQALTDFEDNLTFVSVDTTDGIQLIARAMTAWTVLIEGWLALAFLLGTAHRRLASYTHGCLLLFIATTYAMTPVIGFGWVMASMGYVFAGSARPTIRLLYVLSILLLQVFALPWTSIREAVASSG